MRRRTTILVLGAAAILMFARRTHRHPAADECPFEQQWYQGDLHFWQELTFERGGHGLWETGGMASDAPHERIDFRWERDRETVTAEAGGERRTVRYEIRPRESGCYLWFEAPFLPDDGQSTHWSDRR
jgi:hypothetical protein